MAQSFDGKVGLSSEESFVIIRGKPSWRHRITDSKFFRTLRDRLVAIL